MKTIEIEKKILWTEWSKYNKMSYETLEIVFKQRYLDWDYYFNKANSEYPKHYPIGTVTVTDSLTETLKFYDDWIKEYYIEQRKKGIKVKDIYRDFYNISKDEIGCLSDEKIMYFVDVE